MITRPLDLASKLRPEPRNFDWLFFVNIGAIVLFFALFGSHFVLAPGLGVDFRLPELAGAVTNARAVTHHIDVTSQGQIFTGEGLCKLGDLPKWFAQQAKTTARPVLLLRTSADVPAKLIFDIAGLATNAGFTVQLAAHDQAGKPASGAR